LEIDWLLRPRLCTISTKTFGLTLIAYLPQKAMWAPQLVKAA